MIRREYGGYLSLELSKKKEYYRTTRTYQVAHLHCGRSAIHYAALLSKPRKVYLPYYNCETVSRPFEILGIPVSYYKLSQSFTPEGVALQEGEYLLWVNYFGLSGIETVKQIVDTYKNVYIDNTQAFFSPPVPKAYNIYSCRKFFGVSDGAYLIKKGLPAEIPFSQASSWQNASFLLQSMEEGTNACYSDHLRNEEAIFEKPLQMSASTRNILGSIDYKSVKLARQANFNALHRRLKKINTFIVRTANEIPMVYPLLIDKPKLRDYLIQNRVYVPSWWKHVLEKTNSNDWENQLSRYLIPLPIDQRYITDDMEAIADIIYNFVGEKWGK